MFVVSPVNTTLAFNKYVEKNFITSKIKLLCNNDLVNGEWNSCTGNQYDVLWTCKHSITITDALDIKVKSNVNIFYE